MKQSDEVQEISLCFRIIDKPNSKFDLNIKEALHINWRKPNLNAQQNHLALTLSLQLLSPLVLFCLSLFLLLWSFFSVSILSIIFIISDIIISIFYCLYYTSLLPHLITTHFVSHLSVSSIIFIISMLIISFFYCFSYTSLLPHLSITHLVIDFIITM